MEVKRRGIRRRQHRPTTFLHVLPHRQRHQISDRRFRLHHDLHRPRTPLHRHVKQQFRRHSRPILRRGNGKTSVGDKIRHRPRPANLRRRHPAERRRRRRVLHIPLWHDWAKLCTKNDFGNRNSKFFPIFRSDYYIPWFVWFNRRNLTNLRRGKPRATKELRLWECGWGGFEAIITRRVKS